MTTKEQTMLQLTRLAGISLVLALGACAGMGGAPAKYSDGVMTNGNGMTLYTFDKDSPGSGKSVCNGPCAKNWPAFAAAADSNPAGDWTIVTRDDGTKQWAYKGRPLYTFVKDQKPGDKIGDGFLNNAWHVVKE